MPQHNGVRWTFVLTFAATLLAMVFGFFGNWIRDNFFEEHSDTFDKAMPFIILFVVTVLVTSWIVSGVKTKQFNKYIENMKDDHSTLPSEVVRLEKKNDELRSELQSYESLAVRKIGRDYHRHEEDEQ